MAKGENISPGDVNLLESILLRDGQKAWDIRKNHGCGGFLYRERGEVLGEKKMDRS